jgi:hypothetical protein
MTPRNPTTGRYTSARTPQGQQALLGVDLPANIVGRLYAAGVDVDALYSMTYPGDRPRVVVLRDRAAERVRVDAMIGREPGRDGR